jgi:FkbM family methyltransferase
MIRQLILRITRRLTARRLRLGPPLVHTNFMGCAMLVRAHEDVGRSMALGAFETDDLQHFIAAVGPKDVVFDVGANIGAYCVPIGRSLPDATVHAFEPIELNASLIQVSLYMSRLHNVQIVRKCVSDHTGLVNFSLSEDSAYSSMIDTGRKAEVRRIQCEAVSLDDYCSANAGLRPDIMKIDVEGAELKVLDGARQLLSDPNRRPKLLLIELYDQNLAPFGTSIDAVTARMASHGYRAYVLVERRPVQFSREHHNVIYNVFFSCG